MAQGDISIFNVARAKMIAGGWALTDVFNLAIMTAVITPTVADVTPTWADYSANEVSDAGTYTLGGESLGALSTLVSQTAGVMTFDSSAAPSYAADASNDATAAAWAIIYNTVTDDAVGFIELGSVAMVSSPLTITINPLGIFTIT